MLTFRKLLRSRFSLRTCCWTYTARSWCPALIEQEVKAFVQPRQTKAPVAGALCSGGDGHVVSHWRVFGCRCHQQRLDGKWSLEFDIRFIEANIHSIVMLVYYILRFIPHGSRLNGRGSCTTLQETSRNKNITNWMKSKGPWDLVSNTSLAFANLLYNLKAH